MTVDELLKAKEIIENDKKKNDKKTVVCNANTAKVLQASEIGKHLKIVVSEYICDNQCVLYYNLF